MLPRQPVPRRRSPAPVPAPTRAPARVLSAIQGFGAQQEAERQALAARQAREAEERRQALGPSASSAPSPSAPSWRRDSAPARSPSYARRATLEASRRRSTRRRTGGARGGRDNARFRHLHH
eukprot:tig00020936_g16188.t1